MAFPLDPDALANLNIYRMCNDKHPVFNGVGAGMYGARWNPVGCEVIYCSSSLSLAALEVLANLNTSGTKAKYHYGVTQLNAQPKASFYSPEDLDKAGVKWNDENDRSQTQAFGEQWFTSMQSLYLVLPSLLSPEDFNILINSQHPDYQAPSLQSSPHIPYSFDRRLFKDKPSDDDRIFKVSTKWD